MKNVELQSHEFFKRLIKVSPEIKKVFEKEDEYLKKVIIKNSVILDVGCGFGRHLKMFSNRAKKIIGIDNSKDEIKSAKVFLRGIENIKLFLEDIRKTHFGNNKFDFVISMGNTFGNIENNKIKILKEMKRVCKKGGKIILSVYSENSSKIRVKAYKKSGLKIKEVKNGIVYFEEGLISEEFSKEQLTEFFDFIGLEVRVIKITPISYICEVEV